MKLLISATLAVAAIGLSACADQASAPSEPVAPAAPVAPGPTAETAPDAQAKAVELIRWYTGSEQPPLFVEEVFGGLIAVAMVDIEGNAQMHYTSPDGQFMVHGPLFNRDGKNPTVGLADGKGVSVGARTFVENADRTVDVTEAGVAAVKAAEAEVVGDGKKDLYVVVDPACPYCRQSHMQFEDPEARKHLRVHWILADSVGRDRSQLQISKFLAGDISFDDMMLQPLPNEGAPEPDPATVARVAEGMNLLQTVVRRVAVPAVVYEEDGRWIARTGFSIEPFVELAKREAEKAAAAGGEEG